MAATAAAAGAALGGLNPNPRPKPKPNPSASRPGLRSPGKPAALADITNTGRPNPPRPISIGDVLKENAKLVQLLAQKTKIIELSDSEINKLRFALHASRQKNQHLAQKNSQISAELNQGKDRLMVLQHELACERAVLKLKGSGLERKSSTFNNQLQKEATSQEEINAAPFEFPPMEALQETTTSLPFNIKHPDPPQKRATKRVANKRKLDAFEGPKDSNIEDITTKLHSTSSEPLHHEETRKSRMRKSSRLNPGPHEGTLEPAQEDIIAPVPPSSSEIFIEQGETEKQNARRSSTEPSKEQEAGKRSSVEVTGRRSSMRGAAKAVSYKEIPLNVKMRRP